MNTDLYFHFQPYSHVTRDVSYCFSAAAAAIAAAGVYSLLSKIGGRDSRHKDGV
jgi:hypothetical protein